MDTQTQNLVKAIRIVALTIFIPIFTAVIYYGVILGQFTNNLNY